MNVFDMSLSAGILILFIILMRFLTIHKLRKRMFVLLWEIALLRLLLPITIQMKFSIMGLVTMFTNRKEAIGSNENMLNTPITRGAYASDILSNVIYYEHKEIPILVIIWIVGALLLFAIFLVAYIKEYKKMQEALPVEDVSYINNWILRNSIKRKIKIMKSDRIATPVTYGIILPKIVLPKMTDMTNTSQLECAMAHELVHIKRFDNMWKIVSVIALCIHWFNPFVWVMYLLFNRDLELSCDEKVISILGENVKQDYALALITMAEQKRGIYLLYNGFGKNAIKERIVGIMKYKKRSILGIGISIILILASANVFAAANTDKNIESESISNTGYSSNKSYEAVKKENILLTEDTINVIKIYEPFGLEYNIKEDEMYYKGKVVRELHDEEIGNFIARTLGASFLEDSVDVRCIYKNGKLSGLRIATEDEYKERTEERIARSETNKATEANETSELAYIISQSEQFSEYQELGLSYDEKKEKLIYKKQIVGYFMDELKADLYYRYTDVTGTIGIMAVRDKDNKITGFEEVDLGVIFN